MDMVSRNITLSGFPVQRDARPDLPRLQLPMCWSHESPRLDPTSTGNQQAAEGHLPVSQCQMIERSTAYRCDCNKALTSSTILFGPFIRIVPAASSYPNMRSVLPRNSFGYVNASYSNRSPSTCRVLGQWVRNLGAGDGGICYQPLRPHTDVSAIPNRVFLPIAFHLKCDSRLVLDDPRA